MCRSHRKRPVIAIEDLGLKLGTLRGDPVELLARLGAQVMLCSYLEAEVTEHLGRVRVLVGEAGNAAWRVVRVACRLDSGYPEQ